MNSKRYRGWLVMLSVVAILTGLLSSSVAAQGNASGSGHANLAVGDGQTRTFSFTAVQQAAGRIVGQGEVNNPSFPIRVHFRIDCVKFVGDNRLIASGPVSHMTDANVVDVGRIAVFAVEDNGSGANAPRDRITTIPDYDPPKSCQEFGFDGDNLRDETLGVNVRPLREIDAGQIKVRP
jgi:hypothetical protein